jgi:phenylalanyl-tRNA synthetase beta chain
MKISLNWLRQYIDINAPVRELEKGLIDLGIEVEAIEDQAGKLDKFVIGKVIERKKHPNADKLSVCSVDAGTGEILNIVCGAPNVDSGQTVCVALVGAIVPNGEFEIKKAKLRGEVSEGMICSARELNLGDDHSGIMVLDTDLPTGTPFAQYLKQNDVVFEIGITPNRGDLLSHLGIATELGALLSQKVKEPEVRINAGGSDLKGKIEVAIENPEGCNRYCGILVNNITVRESPEWLKSYLVSVGSRLINNIVDITNYVMLECGQPLHAFDYDKIGGKKIIVKDAGSTKKFTTLDGKERELRSDILLICDAEKPVALAGIMGGANSEISDSTTNVFIESAYFNPVLTRKSSKFLGLQTDSSYRFERGVDIERTEWACKRAAALMAELGGGVIANGFIDEYPSRLEKLVVDLRVTRLNRITGIEFSKEQAVDLLGKINIPLVKEEGEKLYFEIPQARREDLLREIDLVEEVIRLHGYDNIKVSEYDTIALDTRNYANPVYDNMNIYKNYMISRGFSETITNTLVDNDEAALFTTDYVSLLNPSGKAMSVLRPNLMLGALHSIRHNFNYGAKSLKLFETGDVFYYENSHITENVNKILILAGNSEYEEVNKKDRLVDIYDMKGELEMLLGKFNIEINKLNDYYYGDYYDYRMEYFNQNIVIASITAFSKNFLKKFDIDKPVIVCEIY